MTQAQSDPVQGQIAKQTLTLRHERAGLGRSVPGANPRSVEQIARELQALLAAKAIAPPRQPFGVVLLATCYGRNAQLGMSSSA
jgi:hypothetical protein